MADSFNKHAKQPDGLQNVCRECNRARSKAYYQRNLEKHRTVAGARVVEQRKIQRAYLKELKENTPCTDCGVKYPSYVMDFDHLRDKSYDISAMIGKTSLKTIQAEVDKCEIVCSNCHRVRTFTRVRNKEELV